MTEPPRPVFLFSLPRSGSTLLQRLLAAHPQIATASEPWVLLPFLYTMRRPGVYAEYGHRSMVRAVEDFSGQLHGGREEYLLELRNFAMALYAGAMEGEQRYFLDKTPRYHLVVDEIMELFPDGRFIFLWRQPLAVAASVIDSFGRGHWNLEKYSVDLVDGLENLVAAARRADSRCICVRFEDVVAQPDEEVARILDFLGLPAFPDPAELGSSRPPGRMGDRTGTEQYSAVSTEPLDKWRSTLGTAYRKRWARGYLTRIGASRLEVMGYDYDQLRRDVGGLRATPRKLAPDIARSMHGALNQRLAGRLINPSRGEQRRVAARKGSSQLR